MSDEKPATTRRSPPRPATTPSTRPGVPPPPPASGATGALRGAVESLGPPRQATGEQRSAPAGLAADLGSAGKAMLTEAVFGKRPYLRMAFFNPYNLSLVGGGLAAALLTANPLLALGVLALEGLWLLHAPDSKRLRHILWDPRFDALKQSIEAAERAQRMQALDPGARARVEALVGRRRQIQSLAANNPSFAGDLLRGELVKTDRLVDAFLEMALTCARYESYLAAVDASQLERDRQRYARAAESAEQGGHEDHASIARKNLAIIGKRIEKMEEIRRYLQVARGQLDLIENSFELIADQIVTMQSPQELSGQLDELLDGVEAIRDSARDTEKLLGNMEREF